MLRDAAEHGGGAALHDATAGQEDRALGIGQGGPDRGHGRGRGGGRLAAGPPRRAAGTSAASACTSMGTEMSTGPGRPPIARAYACGRMRASWSTRVTCHWRLVMGSKMRGQVGPGLAVDLLEHAAAEHVGVHVAGEDEHRRGVDVGGGDADGRVHGTRPDGGHDRQRLARDPEVGVREVRRGLLVPDLQERRVARDPRRRPPWAGSRGPGCPPRRARRWPRGDRR